MEQPERIADHDFFNMVEDINNRLNIKIISMEYQALAYVKRNKITAWKRLVLTGKAIEYLYGSDDKRVFSTLPANSVLWVIASSPNRSPSLVAKLNIEKVCKKSSPDLKKIDSQILAHYEFDWIAKASNNSMFFGHNDAGDAILKTIFKRRSGKPWSLSESYDYKKWSPKCGNHLQRPTLIHYNNMLLNPLEKLAEKSSRSVFISWKWKDNKGKESLPLKIAKLLIERGFMVWIDRLALPMWKEKHPSTEYDIKAEHDVKLEKLLKYGYEHCKYLLAINSENYGTKSPGSERNWTLREWEGEISKNNHPIKFYLSNKTNCNDKIASVADYIIDENEPELIVNKFTEIVNKNE